MASELAGGEISDWFSDYLAKRGLRKAAERAAQVAAGSVLEINTAPVTAPPSSSVVSACLVSLSSSVDSVTVPSLHSLLVFAMYVTGVATIFATCFHVTAPYGRHSIGASSAWGSGVNPRLAWLLMESPNLLWCVYFHAKNGVNKLPLTNCIMICMFAGHYVNRSIVYPYRLSSGSKKMPIAVMLSATLFCTWNGFIQAKYLFELKR